MEAEADQAQAEEVSMFLSHEMPQGARVNVLDKDSGKILLRVLDADDESGVYHQRIRGEVVEKVGNIAFVTEVPPGAEYDDGT